MGGTVLTLQLFYPYGRGESPRALSDEERRMALEHAIRLKRTYPIINSVRSLRGHDHERLGLP